MKMISLFSAEDLKPCPIFAEFKLENTLYYELENIQGFKDLSATQQIVIAISRAAAKWGKNYISHSVKEWQELRKRGYYR